MRPEDLEAYDLAMRASPLDWLQIPAQQNSRPIFWPERWRSRADYALPLAMA
jgi:hypothetical protein